ncbi:MAG: hypothetical protein MN733_25635 [Nitrososphaera sp.]|nr:hypothetical protein [Nitrososphaera sp.]
MKINASMSHRIKPRLAVMGSALAAGLISSLAVSALILLVEKVAQLPVGTFYLVLASAVLQTQSHSSEVIALGLLMHLAAGSVLGVAISIPFCVSAKWFAVSGRYSPVYGLGAGVAIWLALFLPITFGLTLPFLNSLDDQLIEQRVPTGEVSSIATGELLAITDKVIIGSLAFNMFFGLLVAMLTKSFSEVYMRRNQVII